MRKIILIASCFTSLFLNSCQTDDIEPEITVSISGEPLIISENGGVSTIKATLNFASKNEVVVRLSTSGTAIGNGIDYNLISTDIRIATGSLSQTITLTAIQDTIQEGNETAIISVFEVIDAEIDGTSELTITIEDDDVAAVPQILLNEILYDPWNSGLNGDANGDGQYSQAEDEFVEFINMSSQPLDMSGFKIFDASAFSSGNPRHTIPTGTIIQPGKALVVFGGGTPTGSFGGATVQTSTTGDLNLNNAGDIMTLTDANENVLISFDIEPLSANPNESYTRNPDLSGDFVQHSTVNSALFSPGTKVDGSPF